VALRLPDEPVDHDDVSTAAERAQGRIALVDGPDELMALLDTPLALWSVFLHATQEELAYRPTYAGSAQVTGGPGTGKTIVALRRVKHLATTRDLPPGSILLTTFTRGLAESLERRPLTNWLPGRPWCDHGQPRLIIVERDAQLSRGPPRVCSMWRSRNGTRRSDRRDRDRDRGRRGASGTRCHRHSRRPR
jgi:hypothetical protein